MPEGRLQRTREAYIVRPWRDTYEPVTISLAPLPRYDILHGYAALGRESGGCGAAPAVNETVRPQQTGAVTWLTVE